MIQLLIQLLIRRNTTLNLENYNNLLFKCYIDQPTLPPSVRLLLMLYHDTDADDEADDDAVDDADDDHLDANI